MSLQRFFTYIQVTFRHPYTLCKSHVVCTFCSRAPKRCAAVGPPVHAAAVAADAAGPLMLGGSTSLSTTHVTGPLPSANAATYSSTRTTINTPAVPADTAGVGGTTGSSSSKGVTAGVCARSKQGEPWLHVCMQPVLVLVLCCRLAGLAVTTHQCLASHLLCMHKADECPLVLCADGCFWCATVAQTPEYENSQHSQCPIRKLHAMWCIWQSPAGSKLIAGEAGMP